jgi:hypothetical protein
MAKISGFYNTDTGNRDLGSEKMFSKEIAWINVLTKAIEMNAYLVVETSYVSEEKPGHYYIKGYREKKTYDEIKTLLDTNQRENKYSRRKSWLIRL